MEPTFYGNDATKKMRDIMKNKFTIGPILKPQVLHITHTLQEK